MALKHGNATVQNYIFDYGKKHIVSNYKVNNITVWNNDGWIPDFSNPTPDSYFTFTEIYDGTYSIGAKDITDLPEDLILPSTYNGKTVTQIANGSFGDKTLTNFAPSIKRVAIPDSITEIDSLSFVYCNNLHTVIMSKSIKVINNAAFFGCSSLISISLPEGLLELANNVFTMCSALERVVIPSSVVDIGTRCFSECPKLTIYCRASSKPSGWDSDWNNNRPVVWDYTGN